MDRTLIILLVALGLVYLAWLSAKRQTAVARQRTAAQLERNSCTLEPHETPSGRGFMVETAAGRRTDGTDLRWSADGLEMMSVEAFRDSPESGGAAGFAPGLNVELIDGDEAGEPLLWVWDRSMTARAGVIPRERADDVRRWLDEGSVGECVVVWEQLSGTRRTGLRLLLVHRDMVLDA